MKYSDPSLLSCWPDGYSRYYSVTSTLRIIFGEENFLSILDVGGDSEWMAKFLDNEGIAYKLNIVDTRKPDFKSVNPSITYTQNDFFKLKRSEHASDAVINTDVLEHIPQELKVPFVKQCIEFADKVAIFSAPQEDNEVTAAEQQINHYYKRFSGKQQRWLKEHFKYGKPDPRIIETTITKAGLPYIVINTNELENWFVSFSLNFINTEVCPLLGMDDLNRFYNEHIHSVGDFSGKPYRKIFIVFKDQGLYKEKKDVITSFFSPNYKDKITFLSRTLALLTENISLQYGKFQSAQESIKELNERLALIDKELGQTQEAFVATSNELDRTSNELDRIKASRIYRYAQKTKKIIGRSAS